MTASGADVWYITTGYERTLVTREPQCTMVLEQLIADAPKSRWVSRRA